MKKKILFILMSVLVFSLTLTGCSTSEKTTETNTTIKEVKTDEVKDSEEITGTDNKDMVKDDEEKETPVKNTILEKGTMVLGLDDSFPPMGFRDDKGEIVGFDIDLAREATKRMGIELDIKPIDWATKVLVLNKGEIDVIWNGFTADDERRKQVDFTDPYLANKQILVVSSASDIAKKSDLKGKILGLQSGSTSQDALEKDQDTMNSLKDIKKYSDNVKALLDLKIGRVDSVLVDEVVGRYYVAKKPGDYVILEENFGEEEYAVGVRKGEEAFLAKLNQTLKEIREDGTEAKISEKWFGEDITNK